MFLSNKVYDVLKFICQIVLPALGTLYFALAGIWNFPYGEEVVGTITAIDTFLGTVLMISSNQYYKDE
ncbi:MAG: phage holin [Clostridia bacterium]